MNRNTDVFGKSGHAANERGTGAGGAAKTRISAGASWIRGCTILSLLIAIVACQLGQADEGSTLPAGSETDGGATTVSVASIDESTPISGLRPAARSYRQRYLSDIAPLIVYCMNDLGWEATYDPRLGVFLPEVPFSQQMDREVAMSFCVAGSRTNRGIYAD